MALVVACVGVWVWRRPEQLFHPYVWAEESWVLGYFVQGDWFGVLKPLEGYLTLPTNVLIALAAAISFVHLPGLMYGFALLMFVATILIIAVPDSRFGDWHSRAIMALTASLVPANPEVFGVLLYCSWWSTLWPIAIIGWKRTWWPLRAPLLAIAGFSSPAGGALCVLFLCSYIGSRRRRELISGAILFAAFVPQTLLTVTSPRAAMVLHPTVRAILRQVLVTAGFFEGTWLTTPYSMPTFLAALGLLFLLFLTVSSAAVAVRSRRNEALLLNVAGLIFTLMSAIPAPLLSNPRDAGPRYYFLPFVVYAWTLVHLWRTSDSSSLRVVSATLLAVSFASLPDTFSRSPDTRTARLSWAEELTKCKESTDAISHIPIYFAGGSRFWAPLDLTPAQCRELAR